MKIKKVKIKETNNISNSDIIISKKIIDCENSFNEINEILLELDLPILNVNLLKLVNRKPLVKEHKLKLKQ